MTYSRWDSYIHPKYVMCLSVTHSISHLCCAFSLETPHCVQSQTEIHSNVLTLLLIYTLLSVIVVILDDILCACMYPLPGLLLMLTGSFPLLSSLFGTFV